ncbi:hypothetical protein BCR43DRAFT_194439 [Syncephalastrum racemosum]|uniref:GATA-type domain-containing protein n=1 Tax=Syncephalastrum racemosum TaxID=13706 RepID=A0A1X2HHG1_SYNRA|nr:hypothetical protein BCR43DRAFT_194439 [Syncephalastrum racemosum]
MCGDLTSRGRDNNNSVTCRFNCFSYLMAPLVLKVKNDHAPFSSFSAVECEDDITQAWRVIHKVSNALEHGSRLENLSWRLWFRHQLMNRNGNHGHFAGLKEDTADLLDRGGYDLGSFGEQFWYGHEPKKKLSKMKKKQVIRPPPLSQPTAQHHHHHHQHLHPSQTHHPNIHTPSMMMQQQQQQAQQSLSSSATLMMQQPSEMHIDELLSHPARSLQHDHVTPEWAQTGQTSQQHHQSHPQQQQQQQQHSPRSAAFDTASIFAESAQSLQAALSMDFEDHGAASLLDQQNMLVDRMASFSVASPLSPTSRQTQPDGNALYMTTGGSMPPPPSATLGHKLYDHEQSMHRHQQLPHASSYNPTAESSHMMTSYSSSMQHTYTPQQEHHHTPSDETIPVQQQHIMSLLAEAGMFDGDPKQLHSTPPPQTAPNVMASSSSSSRSIQRIGVGYEDTDPRLNRSSTSEVFSDDDDDSTDDDSDDDTSSDSDSDASSDDTPICTNCGATSTPLWRRSNEDELLCNACGLYQKLHNAPRPKSLRPNNPRKETREDLTPKITCSNCGTNNTPLWRRDGEGAPLCNACGL